MAQFVFNSNPNFQPGGPSAQQGAGLQYANPQSAPSPEYSAEQMQQMYDQPPASNAQMGRMTFDDVLIKTVLCFGLVLIGAVVGWIFPVLMLPGMIVGFVLGLVNAFKKEPNKFLILTYALFQGFFVGGISGVLESSYSGIVLQAVLGTLIVFGVTLALYASGKFRATPKMTRIFVIAMGSYFVFSLVNLGLMMFNVTDDPWGLRGIKIFGIPLGVIIGILAIMMASYSLVLDFTFVDEGIKNAIPARYAWTAAFGITMTTVWLYVEILRLLAILRGDN